MPCQYIRLHKKNCSWPPKKLGAFYLSLCIVIAILSGIFLYLGLWLVVPFGLLEISALACAFVAYARGAVDCERIAVEGRILIIEQQHADHITRHLFNLDWTRIEWLGPDRSQLFVCQGKSRVPVGQFLAASQRKAFAAELKNWMSGGSACAAFA